MFQVGVFAFLCALCCGEKGWVQLGLEVEHVVQGKLAQIKLLGLDELLFELLHISNHSDSLALVEVSRLVDPKPSSLVVKELDLITHDIQPVGLWDELVHLESLAFAFTL